MVSFENAWDSTKNSHFGGPFSRQVWNRTQPRIPSERNAELQRRSRPWSGSKRRGMFLLFAFFVLCCVLGCFLFFWMMNSMNHPERHDFYFKKNTWAQHEHWVFEPPRAGVIAGGSRGSRLWTVLDCLLLRAWYEVCQVWKETLIVAMLGNCSSDK